MGNSGSMGSFLLGLGVGTAVAMIFAPKSGAETREFLQTKSRETAEDLKRQGQQLRDRAADTIEHGKQVFRDPVTRLTEAVNAGKEAYRETVEEAANPVGV